MKSLLKLVSQTLCITLLLSCQVKVQKSKSNMVQNNQEPVRVQKSKNIAGHIYADYEYLKTNANTYAQIGDSTYSFNHIELYYGSYEPTFRNNHFMIRLMDSVRVWKSSVQFDLFTDIMEPQLFFRKGCWIIDTMYICNDGISYDNFYYRSNHFGDIRAVFSWEYVFREKRPVIGSLDEYTEELLSHGKGSFEIMDTIYTEFPEIYYPPQKIEFEF